MYVNNHRRLEAICVVCVLLLVICAYIYIICELAGQ